MLTRLVSFAAFIAVVMACSQVSYKPAISGKGVIAAKDSLVYSIPPANPTIKMKLTYHGIENGNQLRVQMRFVNQDHGNCGRQQSSCRHWD